VDITLVVSDRAAAPALARAVSAGIPIEAVDGSVHPDREGFSNELKSVFDRHPVDALVLAGFMRILSHDVVDRFRDRILNIHPSLLPSFPGARAVEQALEHGVKVTGVTVHFVDEKVDHGPIIAQSAIPVMADDDVSSLHARIQIEEHALYPVVVAAFARGDIGVEDGSVVWR
jgi:phosphoribosylglycinamide formyltransferase 1